MMPALSSGETEYERSEMLWRDQIFKARQFKN